MAKFPRRILGSIPSQIRTFVSWLLDRFFTKKEVIQRVGERFGAGRKQVTETEISYYKSQQSAAERFRKSEPGTLISSLNVPQTGRVILARRFHVTFTFDNPTTGQKQIRGYPIDIEYTNSKRWTQDEIRRKIINDILKDYANRIQPGRQLGDMVGPITVTRIEGI